MAWEDAVAYVKTYKGSGYTDWRMPTTSELESLLDPWLKSPKGFKLTKYIDIQACCPWTLEKKRKDTEDQYRAVFDFFNGLPYFAPRNHAEKSPALPVRDTVK